MLGSYFTIKSTAYPLMCDRMSLYKLYRIEGHDNEWSVIWTYDDKGRKIWLKQDAIIINYVRTDNNERERG